MIPQNLIEKYTPKIKGTTAFGVSIEKLSREELMVLLVFLSETYTKSLENNMRNMQFLRDLHRRE